MGSGNKGYERRENRVREAGEKVTGDEQTEHGRRENGV